MRFVDKESSLLKTALIGKTRRFVRTALFFKYLNRAALKFKRYAYKQSSQKKDFFGALKDVDNLLTGRRAFADSIALLPGKDSAFTPVKRFGIEKICAARANFGAALRLLFRLAAARQGKCVCAWPPRALSGLLPYSKRELNDDETL